VTTTYTTNKLYPIQSYGSNINTWGDVANDQLIQVLDKNLGGALHKDISGDENVTLTADEAQNLILVLEGALLGNINFIVPNRGAIYTVTNNASGPFSVTFIPYLGTGFILPVGETILVQVDASVSDAAVATQVPPTPSGSNVGNITTISSSDSPYTTQSTDFAINCDCTAGAITVNLSGPSKSWFRVKKIDGSANQVTIVGTIDGTSNYVIPFQGQSIDLQKNSTGWWIY
jgi:hypothetical protein